MKFIANDYSAYPLASQQCKLVKGWDFDVTQVIGLTNDDAVSTEFRWIKEVVERLTVPSNPLIVLLVAMGVKMVLFTTYLFGSLTTIFCVRILIITGDH